MEGLTFRYVMAIAVPLVFALLTGSLLLSSHWKNKNPLEWSLVDRCLLIVALFCFAGSISNAIFAFGSAIHFDRLSWVNWTFIDSIYGGYQVFGSLLIFLLFIGVMLRRRSPENRVFGHIIVQYNAISMAAICYLFGPATHPAPFLLSMALGTLNFLLFGPAFGIPWLTTFVLANVGSAIVTGFGLLPYAPIFNVSPFSEGKVDGLYLIGTLSFVVIIFPLMLAFMAYIFVRWQEREARVAEMKDLLKKMFGRYLSAEVMKTILEDPTGMEMGGDRRFVTIMMTDLRGFTALSERLEPEKVVQILNAYFEAMVDVVLKYQGTINEIIGDALLVIFGAPQEMPDRAERAIASAITMQNAMKAVNEKNRQEGLPEVEMGIGLNEAEVIVGNIGSSKRSKYGVVGSGVNMTSRIESYTVGGQILISESVRRAAGDVLRIDSEREVQPKGAGRPMKVYEVGGIAGRYHLTLEEKPPSLVQLKTPIPVKCRALDGKDIGKRDLMGHLTGLSRKGAMLRLDAPVALFANLKINLADVDKGLAIKDFYGKVIEKNAGGKEMHFVRFTALPPEIGYYFQALRQFAARTSDC